MEVLTSHYPNGIPEESIVSRILYDISLGLHNLHKQQQCHRNFRASSIHIDIDTGKGLLTEFAELKEIKWKHASGRRNTFISPEREPFTDPLNTKYGTPQDPNQEPCDPRKCIRKGDNVAYCGEVIMNGQKFVDCVCSAQFKLSVGVCIPLSSPNCCFTWRENCQKILYY